MSKRLVDLDPSWITEQGRPRMGVIFLCPCCVGTDRERYLFTLFKNPVDGGPPAPPEGSPRWTRTVDSFETLTLSPSIDVSASGHWHGFIQNGELT